MISLTLRTLQIAMLVTAIHVHLFMLILNAAVMFRTAAHCYCKLTNTIYATMADAAAQAHSVKGIALPAEVVGHGKRIGIVHTQWNKEIIEALVGGAREELLHRGVAEEDIVMLSVSVILRDSV